MGFPDLDADAVESILHSEGQQFAKAVEQLSGNGYQKDSSRDYVAAVISAVTPLTRRVITEIAGMGIIANEDLIEISKAEGRAFRSAIKAVAENMDESSSEIDYLRRTLSISSGLLFKPELPPKEKAITPAPIENKTHGGAPTSLAKNRIEENAKYRTVHIYAKQAAVCIAEDVTRKSMQPTIRFEMAKSTSEGQYDWQNKAAFQCTPGELALLYGVFYGLAEKVEFTAHGSNNDKCLTLSNQDAKFYINLKIGKSIGYGVPISPADAYLPMTMIFNRLKEGAQGIDDQTLMSIITRICQKANT
jgi:hypothetical protein